jgi:hypothetical protein
MEFKEFFRNFDAPEIKNKPFNYQKLRGNLSPKMDATRIVPINIDEESYKILNKYVTPRFEMASDLLDRRKSEEELMASNEEIADLLSLAKTIAINSNDLLEIKTIKGFIDRLTTH